MELIKDLITYIKYKFREKNYSHLIFCENNNLFLYLQDLIKRKKSSQVLFSLEKINLDSIDIDYIYFKTNFFRKFFFLNLKVKYIYSTTPDLNNSLFMRSVNKICKYIYIQHSSVSLNMAYDDNAFINFDAVQVINKFQSKEIDKINILKKKKIKKIKAKYSLFKNQTILKNNYSTKVLIAPTWNTDFYKLNLHNHLIELLNKHKIDFEFKPHYMSYKKKEFEDDFLFKKNVVLNINIIKELHKYSHLITDWSGIFFEFAFLNKKKPILIETYKKIRNSNYLAVNESPIEVYSRHKIGNVIDINLISNIPDLIHDTKLNDVEEIKTFFNKNFYL